MTDLIIKSFGMYGLTIVISMLAALLIKVIVLSIAKSEDRRKQASKAKSKVAAAKPVLSGQVDPAHIAAISAAVYAVLGSHRIIHISDGRRAPGWASEGKRQLQSSHDVHRTK